MRNREPDRLLVEQAKGVVMLRYGVSSYESLAALARWAREAHVPLPELAHALVKGVCQGRTTPDDRGLVRWLEHRLRADIGEAADVPPRTGMPPVPMARRGGSGASVRVGGGMGGGIGGDMDGGVDGGVGGGGRQARQWRYASAVHAARALGSP